ncbi:MAG: nuclear transport factor 2 family protein [Rhodospirillaceae bacterium]|jgi:hypothetical protein|nr:nuclear transport factor 2 family protein [Rhodospirillaceae bacterium]MBT4043692.1 nuclear transport factor 2 family protein [Rhodospirillaceae bacterium]MBT4686965.1 nuclear transport factor 2 family protein [Rhodospirillaceae bacterium]MBT5081789.1 nuclear transport factor 2 family protein [Rhodospirillaceae bacterium]MBT5525477.1 nuclear transport factor 2 family protein [Rhodospirillaceae bacterium]
MSTAPRQSGHRYIETINRYYDGCNTADYDLMMSTFDEDVVHYFVDHGAVKGAAALANYWVKIGPRTAAHWRLDHAMVEEPECVIEWSMRWTPKPTGVAEVLRGSEWYIFRDDKILEIRSYHNNRFLQDPKNRELWDFPYEARGYTKQSV